MGSNDQGHGILSSLNVNLNPELLWEGSVEEYFKKVIEYPRTVRTAHQRLFDAIESYGSERYSRYRQDVVRWKICDDPFDLNHRHAIYGNNVDVAFMNLVNVIKAASLGLGQEYRAFLLHGPYGTAKSTMAELLAKGLEAFTKKPEGQLFAPFWVVEGGDEEGMEILGTVSRKFERARFDCPLHEEPLAVFPLDIKRPILKKLSDEANRKLGEKAQQNIDVPTNACPQCASIFKRFMRRYNNDWMKVIEKHLRVRRLVLSKAERVGIVVVRPKSEKDQDVSEFLGETDFSRLGHYGSVTDPRTFDFAGHYMAANRGFFYWEEKLKFALTFLYDLLGASQEHRVQPKGFMEVDIDEVLLGSTNEPEYQKLKDKEEMQALRDRIIKIDIPYILELRNEIKVYDKFFNESRRGGKHLAPHTVKTAAFWALLTRVSDPKKPDIDRRGKVKLLNGQMVPGFNEDSVKLLMAESERDGMQGISPRYINDKISAAFMNAAPHKNCVNPFSVIKELTDGLRTHPHIKTDEQRTEYGRLIAIAREELTELLKDDLRTAISGDESALKELYRKYIDNLTAFVSKERVKDEVTGEDVPPNEDFMNAIEDMIEISDRETFRQKVVNAMQKRAVERDRDSKVAPFDHRSDERLHRALQLFLFEQEKNKINWESLISRKAVGDDDQRKVDVIKRRLVENLSYCDTCATELMTWVAGIFKRGEREKNSKKK